MGRAQQQGGAADTAAVVAHVHRKLTMLDSAQRVEDLAAVRGNRFERLAGNQKGQHSIRVSEQHRVTFRWENNDAYDVCGEDYH